MAVEVIYDETQTKILDYRQIDPKTLTKKWDESTKSFIYIQYENDKDNKRILSYTQILCVTESFSGLTKQENDLCEYVFETFENLQLSNNCYYNPDGLIVFEYLDGAYSVDYKYELSINSIIWDKFKYHFNISFNIKITNVIINIIEYICDIKVPYEIIWHKSFKYKLKNYVK